MLGYVPHFKIGLNRMIPSDLVVTFERGKKWRFFFKWNVWYVSCDSFQQVLPFFTERKNSVQEEKKTRSKYDPVVREASPPSPAKKHTQELTTNTYIIFDSHLLIWQDILQLWKFFVVQGFFCHGPLRSYVLSKVAMVRKMSACTAIFRRPGLAECAWSIFPLWWWSHRTRRRFFMVTPVWVRIVTGIEFTYTKHSIFYHLCFFWHISNCMLRAHPPRYRTYKHDLSERCFNLDANFAIPSEWHKIKFGLNIRRNVHLYLYICTFVQLKTVHGSEAAEEIFDLLNKKNFLDPPVPLRSLCTSPSFFQAKGVQQRRQCMLLFYLQCTPEHWHKISVTSTLVPCVRDLIVLWAKFRQTVFADVWN